MCKILMPLAMVAMLVASTTMRGLEFKDLHLTVEQRREITAILNDQYREGEELWRTKRVNGPQPEKLKSIKRQTDSRLQQVLSPEQWETWKKLEQQHRARAKAHRQALHERIQKTFKNTQN